MAAGSNDEPPPLLLLLLLDEEEEGKTEAKGKEAGAVVEVGEMDMDWPGVAVLLVADVLWLLVRKYGLIRSSSMADLFNESCRL